MNFRSQYRTSFSVSVFVVMLPLFVGCSSSRRLSQIESGHTAASIALPSDKELPSPEPVTFELPQSSDTMVVDDVFIMDAQLDEKTGEMVATDVINASKVVARFRNVAERMGKIMLEFDIHVPAEMVCSRWQLRFYPSLRTMGDTLNLEPILITGKDYREAQLRGYQRYNAFLASIITDSTAFIDLRQLEVFLKRNFPETYAMKRDTSFVSDSQAKSYFGLSQRQAIDHYTRWWQVSRNLRRKADLPRRFAKYVKSPILSDGIRLDTVLLEGGDLVYRYRQSLQARPLMKRLDLSLSGEIYEFGKRLGEMPRPQDLTFYVSSLSSLADCSLRYIKKILQRKVSLLTLAKISFGQGSSDLVLALGENADEVDRIKSLMLRLEQREEYEADSIVVVASCSPEGRYSSNELLSKRRSRSVASLINQAQDSAKWKVVSRCIAEDWSSLEREVESDSTLSERAKNQILELVRSPLDRDKAEKALSKLPEYGYLRSEIYPRLRAVSLEFKLHLKNMAKDTVVTTEVDTLYGRGVEALKNMDYKKACEILRPYRDYNAALALASGDYNWSALDILDNLREDSARVLYLKTIIYSRLGKYSQAAEAFSRCIEKDPSMTFRANLDPEVSELIRTKSTNNLNP